MSFTNVTRRVVSVDISHTWRGGRERWTDAHARAHTHTEKIITYNDNNEVALFKFTLDNKSQCFGHKLYMKSHKIEKNV